MPEFSIYSSILFIHVISAVVLAGSTLYAPLARGLVRSAESVEDLKRSLDLARRATKWNPLVAFVLLGSGIYLGSWGWWTQAWFFVAAGAWVANSALAVAGITRLEEAMARMVDEARKGPIPVEVDALRHSRTLNLAHGAMLANDIAMFYVMYSKPALSGSLAILALAHAVALAVTFARSPASVRGRAAEQPTSAMFT